MENVVTRIVDKPVFLEAADRTNSHRVYHVLRVATCHFHVLRWRGRGIVGVPSCWNVFLSLPLSPGKSWLVGKQGMPGRTFSSQSNASDIFFLKKWYYDINNLLTFHYSAL